MVLTYDAYSESLESYQLVTTVDNFIRKAMANKKPAKISILTYLFDIAVYLILLCSDK